ncbi:MAG TPA: M20 family metallo-hydrolase [Solirubrobacteraceae bacterium]|nr:M20 family metallo-hydrolase [Solirubrobacteraceae bacterium]
MRPVGTQIRTIHEQLRELAKINADPAAGGITREVFTAEYTRANAYVLALMEQAGLAARIDAFGNLFGRIAGTDPDAAAILTGSHIDTTLNAGAYDGVLGVLGGIEAVRGLLEVGWQPRRPVEVVCFAGEEPRFGSGCIGSRALMGSLHRSDLDAMVDRHGVSIAEAMRRVGFDPDRLGEMRLDPATVEGFVELHIEQGSRLQAAGLPIGVVTHIAAPHDLLVTISGLAAHAGATPMAARRDALAGAAELVVAVERLARSSTSGSTVGTVGVIDARPGAINVIPGEVSIQVDIRDHDLAARTAVVEAFLAETRAVCERRGLTSDLRTITRDEPAACAPVVVDAARGACEMLGTAYTDIVSGAYHDAMVLGAEIPIGMIFVPSRDGISHSPLEYTAPDDVERGIAVLADTLRTLAA